MRPDEEKGASRSPRSNDLSRPTVARPVSKKQTIRAAAADPVERAEFAKRQKTPPVEKLVFVDEFSANIAMPPTSARSPPGERAEASEPFHPGSNHSTISSLSLSGVGPTRRIEGAVDTQVFDADVEKFLVPSLLPGDRALLDNVKFHDSERSSNRIEAAGASVKDIPTDSADFNPIEEFIAKNKEAVRKAKSRTVRKLLNALARAIEKITVDDICGWFAHCGYTFSLI